MRVHGNKNLHVRFGNFSVGDQVLLEQIKTHKASTTYECEPFMILSLDGNRATIERGRQVLCRNVSMLKKFYSTFQQKAVEKNASGNKNHNSSSMTTRLTIPSATVRQEVNQAPPNDVERERAEREGNQKILINENDQPEAEQGSPTVAESGENKQTLLGETQTKYSTSVLITNDSDSNAQAEESTDQYEDLSEQESTDQYEDLS